MARALGALAGGRSAAAVGRQIAAALAAPEVKGGRGLGGGGDVVPEGVCCWRQCRAARWGLGQRTARHQRAASSAARLCSVANDCKPACPNRALQLPRQSRRRRSRVGGPCHSRPAPRPQAAAAALLSRRPAPPASRPWAPAAPSGRCGSRRQQAQRAPRPKRQVRNACSATAARPRPQTHYCCSRQCRCVPLPPCPKRALLKHTSCVAGPPDQASPASSPGTAISGTARGAPPPATPPAHPGPPARVDGGDATGASRMAYDCPALQLVLCTNASQPSNCTVAHT